jgi:hypothetical protein
VEYSDRTVKCAVQCSSYCAVPVQWSTVTVQCSVVRVVRSVQCTVRTPYVQPCSGSTDLVRFFWATLSTFTPSDPSAHSSLQRDYTVL